MASPKQLTANRANAKKSTGPRTPKGKAVSRFNALKFGITAQSLLLPNESVDAFQALAAEYAVRFRPQSPEQRFLVKSLVTTDWFTDRLNRTEPDVWQHDFATTVAIGDGADRDGALLFQHPSFHHYSRLRRCHATLHRTYLATMKELRAEGIQPVDPEPRPEAELGLFCTSSQPIPMVPSAAQPDPRMIQLGPREQIRKVLRKVIREAMRPDPDAGPTPPDTPRSPHPQPLPPSEPANLGEDRSPACPGALSPQTECSSPADAPPGGPAPLPPVPVHLLHEVEAASVPLTKAADNVSANCPVSRNPRPRRPALPRPSAIAAPPHTRKSVSTPKIPVKSPSLGPAPFF